MHWLRWFARLRREGFEGRWPLAHRGGRGVYWPHHWFADDPGSQAAAIDPRDLAGLQVPGITVTVLAPGSNVDAHWCHRGQVVLVEMQQTQRTRVRVRWPDERRRGPLRVAIEVDRPITREVFEDALELAVRCGAFGRKKLRHEVGRRPVELRAPQG